MDRERTLPAEKIVGRLTMFAILNPFVNLLATWWPGPAYVT